MNFITESLRKGDDKFYTDIKLLTAILYLKFRTMDDSSVVAFYLIQSPEMLNMTDEDYTSRMESGENPPEAFIETMKVQLRSQSR